MPKTVLIKLTTAGPDTGPFDLYCVNSLGNIVGPPFENNVSRALLVAGYVSILVPDTCNIIRVKSDNQICTNFIDLVLPTTTTTIPPSTTTSTTSRPTTTSTTTVNLTTSTSSTSTTTTRPATTTSTTTQSASTTTSTTTQSSSTTTSTSTTSSSSTSTSTSTSTTSTTTICPCQTYTFNPGTSSNFTTFNIRTCPGSTPEVVIINNLSAPVTRCVDNNFPIAEGGSGNATFTPGPCGCN